MMASSSRTKSMETKGKSFVRFPMLSSLLVQAQKRVRLGMNRFDLEAETSHVKVAHVAGADNHRTAQAPW
jgi:hypothetical protein